MIDNLILFGVGRMAKKYAAIIKNSNAKIRYFTDNNSNFWGKRIDGIEVLPPEEIKNLECNIIIACRYVEEITKQLSDMGIENRIVTIENFIVEKINTSPMHKNESKKNEAETNKSYHVIIDNLYGKWGGAENWIHTVGYELSKNGMNVTIFENGESPLTKMEEIIRRIDHNEFDFWDFHEYLITLMLQHLPFILIDITCSEMLYAAYAVKSSYPNDVKIIESVLNDDTFLNTKQAFWDEIINVYLCISSRIQRKFQKYYKVSSEKLKFKETFCKVEDYYSKVYNQPNEPIRIAYACRLNKVQKRADLLP